MSIAAHLKIMKSIACSSNSLKHYLLKFILLLITATCARQAPTTAKIIPNVNIICSFLCFLICYPLSFLPFQLQPFDLHPSSVFRPFFQPCSLLASVDSEVHTCESNHCKRYNCCCHYPKCNHNLFPFFFNT